MNGNGKYMALRVVAVTYKWEAFPNHSFSDRLAWSADLVNQLQGTGTYTLQSAERIRAWCIRRPDLLLGRCQIDLAKR